MIRKLGNKLAGLSSKGKFGLAIATLVASIGASGIISTTAVNSNRIKSVAPTPAPAISPNVKSDRVEKKVVKETVTVPFKHETTIDPTLDKGTSKITVKGVNGTKTIIYEVTLNNGTESSRSLVREEITTKLINEIESIGNRDQGGLDCPNGTYVNSSGIEVCRPYESTSTPDGATARCGDGSYSFSQSRSGTCSHHDGVSEWF